MGRDQGRRRSLAEETARRKLLLLRPQLHAPAPIPAPTPPTGLVSAIDVSSHQGYDIGPLIEMYRPDHVITKLYQSIERVNGQSAIPYSIRQAETSRQYGCTTGGYGWLYAGYHGAVQVADFLDTASRAAIRFTPTNPLWLDCEDYESNGAKSWPSVTIIQQAVSECEQLGVPCGIYTGGWWWVPRTGNTTQFSYLPLWASIYDFDPTMVNVAFGGWTVLAGKQWQGSPIDRSTFRAAFAS